MASGGRGNRRDGAAAGRFGGFPDPFANFGMGFGMGGGGSGRGNSIFDVFDNDPFFNDPFFTQPLGSFFGQTAGGGLLGGEGFGFFGDRQQQYQLRPPPRTAGYIDHRPHNPAQVHQRDPVVVELEDDDDYVGDDVERRVSSHSAQEPIVEHPDDDVRLVAEERPHQPRNVSRQLGPLSMPQNNGARAYSFQSSSVSYGGPNGTYYSSSAMRRMGPDGVVEEEFQEKDSTAGHELKRISRGLGDKGRSILRKRNSEGRESAMEALHNLREEEVPEFDRTWEEKSKNLPQWNLNRPHTIGSAHGSGSRSRAALPTIGHANGGWPSN